MLELVAQWAQIQAIVENAGFGILYAILHGVVDLTTCFVNHGVVKQFWDNTNTFCLPFVEMTISPFGFAVY